ncbi:Ltp family lipoprotein [Xylocopilactobacillus apicola]|uniref:Putative host cell surface-exposed lipoprotein Ltp-like HTH region domain-containing protein n=1 Tax=Xylocopilactobacillus apicola TaxID=2932184 RepID=A0AAU9D446_9LACO|nr:Ltp family lipoprotein [Xylocopilactobacillus apicola]BDR58258.1 hypothetical protein XA3_06990 [Xylocopilactobacillus apicola]
MKKRRKIYQTWEFWVIVALAILVVSPRLKLPQFRLEFRKHDPKTVAPKKINNVNLAIDEIKSHTELGLLTSRKALFLRLTAPKGDGLVFSEEAANQAIDKMKFNWNKSATECAKRLLDGIINKRSELIKFLVDQYLFLPSEAEYALKHVKVDWTQKALQEAQRSVNQINYSKQMLYELLIDKERSGFTESEAHFAVNNINVNWSELALKSALKTKHENRDIEKELERQKFTSDQIDYALQHVDD